MRSGVRLAVGTALAALAGLVASGDAAAAQLVPVGTGFGDPLFVTAPPRDPHRLFVVERAGVIEVLHDGVRKTFLTLPVDSDVEGGLLSMAFAPDYATSGRFYVDYTAPRPGDADGLVVTIAEFRRSATDPDSADPTSQRTVLAIDHPGTAHHNGGQLQFGPDGYLYASVGDGGVNNDPGDNAQNLGVLLGKIIRIDPRQQGGAPYTVPPDNPFVGNPAARPEIYALGLRNPWRFSFDRQTGDMVIGDVGESAAEEVDFAPRGTGAGENYGWHCREGFGPSSQPCSGSFVDPVFAFGHTGTGCTGAITSGYVVRNHDLDSLYGRYLFADFCALSGDIRSLALAKPTATDTGSTGMAMRSIYSFGEDSCGHIYIGSASGEVDVLLDDPARFTPCPEPPPPPPKPKDRTPPALTVAHAASEEIADRRYVQVKLACDERCGTVTSGTLVLPHAGRTFDLTGASRQLGAGTPVRLRLFFTRDAAAAARRTIANGYTAWAFLKVTARDAAGNQTVRRLRMQLVD